MEASAKRRTRRPLATAVYAGTPLRVGVYSRCISEIVRHLHCKVVALRFGGALDSIILAADWPPTDPLYVQVPIKDPALPESRAKRKLLLIADSSSFVVDS
jgi:hypothetical protein